MSRALLLAWLCAGCRLYAPTVLDCQVRCGAANACPVDTTCQAGFCRVQGAVGPCECSEGQARPCGSATGTCREGTQRCEGHLWGACEGAVGPRAEQCNGLDDDCDGVVDEEIALPPTCALTLGVCADSRQRCEGGAWQPCPPQRYGPKYELNEARCDGEDNDCDGLVDSRAPVLLAEGVTGPWSLLGSARGFVLVAERDAGLEVRWLEPSLSPWAAQRLPPHPGVRASVAGEQVFLLTPGSGGLEVEARWPDGGAAVQTFADWSGALALQAAGEVVVASVGGEVQVRSLVDGGAPRPLGPDVGPAFTLSASGRTLAWSGGLSFTDPPEVRSSNQPGPLLALLELDATRLAGVPATQPGTAAPLYFGDLFSAAPPSPINPLRVPPLQSLQATEHLGRGLLVGLEAASRLWLVTEGGAQSFTLPGELRATRTAATGEPFALVAWQSDEQLWGLRRCAP